MKRLLLAAALATALAGSAVALAAGGAPIKETVVGAASIGRAYTLRIAKPADAVVARAVVPPGASFGWHFHRAAVVAMVQSGALTLYDGADPTCAPSRYTAGHGFVEQRHHVHLARNEGEKTAVVLVTYLGLKHGAAPDVAVQPPGNCAF